MVEEKRKKNKKKKKDKRKAMKEVARGAGRKEFSRRWSGGRGAESSPKGCVEEQKGTDKERRKGRQARGRETLDGVWREGENGI